MLEGKLEPVFLCPLNEDHKANNVAEFLERRSIKASLLHDEGGRKAMTIVAVQPADAERAMELVTSFLSNYDRSVSSLATEDIESRRHPSSWIGLTIFPTLAMLWGALRLLNTLRWSETRGLRLADGVDDLAPVWGALALAAGLVVFVWVVAKHRHRPD